MMVNVQNNILRLLKNSSFIFAISIILGFTLPNAAKYSEPLITPALIVMMTFSLTEIDFRANFVPGTEPRQPYINGKGRIDWRYTFVLQG